MYIDHIHTIHTPNTPLNTLYTLYIRPICALNTPYIHHYMVGTVYIDGLVLPASAVRSWTHSKVRNNLLTHINT